MIRAAIAADADAIAALQGRAWRRAYADFLPPEASEPDAAAARRAGWGEVLAAPAERPTTLVWDQDGIVAGFAAVGAARDDAATPGCGELMALYVDPVAQGAGVGRALLDAAHTLLREAGYAEAVLWVFERNEAARALYERRGWILDPGAVGPAGWWAPAVRYRRGLAPART